MNSMTPTINGLRLVSPEEAGYQDKDRFSNDVTAVIMNGSKPQWYVWNRGESVGVVDGYDLLPLPKPRTTRPYKRGEVKWEWKFRSKYSGIDYQVAGVSENGVYFVAIGLTEFHELHDNFDRLTYDSEGREVLSVAGVEG